ncbi:MAG TPA: peroxiredoxin [bacterium]|nr:peroxiredoxin [bacterium]
MAGPDNWLDLPPNLPVPKDDGACDHLTGMPLPSVPLASTAGRAVDLAALPGTTVVYAYPRTGHPGVPSPAGWDAIPGARGCTPQSCAFRDHHGEFAALGARVFGLSAQTIEDQREAVERLHLPMALLSDVDLAFARALRLPTFVVESLVLIKRLTLVVRNGRIATVFYPVFPPNKNAEEVLAWLRRHPSPA